MKNVICLCALILFSNMAKAQESKSSYCDGLDKIATKIMQIRQQGYPFAELIKIMPDKNVLPMLISAYETYQFTGEEARTQAVNAFRNDVFLKCIKSK